MTPHPRNIVHASPHQKRVMYRDGNTTDIIRVILHADKDSARWVNTEGLARLKGADSRATLQNIYALMQGRINYRADRPGHEIVRSPAYLFGTATGDCKSYSVAIGAFCRAFGIPYRYRFTSQSNKDYHHVYVVATVGGKDVVMDAVPDNAGRYLAFGKERGYRRHADVRPGQKVPAGIRGSSGSDFWIDTLTLLGVVVVGGFILKRIK